MGEFVLFRRPDGLTAPGYLALPAKGHQAPGVVVVQEWWGLNDQIKGTADRLAAAGFRALTPDLFRGRRAANPDETSHPMSGLNWTDALTQDLRGAAAYLKAAGQGPIAILGFCMGGALSLLGLAKVDEFDAGVCFYGIPPTHAGDITRTRKPLLCHFAQQDAWCTPHAVVELEAKLQRAGVPLELHRYEARHGFFNEKRVGHYDPKASALAWTRSLDFLQQNLH